MSRAPDARRAPHARRALDAWDLGPGPLDVHPAAAGHINRSWTLSRPGAPEPSWMLQRLNEQVFPHPELVIENVAHVTAHLARAVRAAGLEDPERCALTLVPTREERSCHRDSEGGVWRLYPFIGGTRVLEHVTTPEAAREVGRAFGRFQRLLGDYHGPRLHETIPRFHDTAWRLARLDDALAADREGRLAGCRAEADALLSRRALAGRLAPLLASGALPERIAHNDAKSGNVLLDASTGAARCVVDLDTVMPGSALWDFGDMVRSTTSPTAEDEPEVARVRARPDLFAGLAEGYLAEAGATLTAAEREHLVTAGLVLTFEQAVRFLADHLDGDRYFRVARPGHNLDRARTQLALLLSLERQEEQLRDIVTRIV